LAREWKRLPVLARRSSRGCPSSDRRTSLLARRRTMLELDRPRLPAALTALVIAVGMLIAFL
jgi:hypothetical protein